ncbi:hypothetical protein PRIPAC_71375 [Pristionchus pacificus]|uniref:Uncharacterized protein n=1 Tax=Pristionchus pacificus TaxID=54126 RepID=A0A2A6C1G3_PRIPA|nr:hypothetical protein PRIPAC_71375 [Pristionchus pacificus]|eukprot:PDM71956.1 hypothetical protein PRIPAC_38363 [Pristionchus pacificus]
MARTAHPLKRPAKGASSSRKKRPHKTPRLDSLAIDVKCDHLTCSFLSINRRYCDEAVEILKTRLSEKLTAAKVERIGHLRIATPGHITNFLEFFNSLSIQFITLEVITTIHSLISDDWIDSALTLPTSSNVKLSLSNMYDGKTDLVAGIIDKLLIYGKASIELLDKLHASSMLLTVDGILEAVAAMSNREVNARIQFQLDTNAREFKAAILEKWNLAEIIDREFDELNTPRTALLEIDGFTLYNEGCENLCLFDGRILLKMPTEFVLDGRLANKNMHPHRFTIERVMDKTKHVMSFIGFVEVKHK